MASTALHVESRTNGQWAVRKAGAERATKVLGSKTEAVSIGRRLARKANAELFIHRQDGRVQEMETYGNDPVPPSHVK